MHIIFIKNIKKFYFEIIIGIILVIMYLSYLPNWFSEWTNSESPYSFAFFMFAFIIYFLKINYKNLANTPKTGSMYGMFLLLTGFVLYIIGLRADINYFASLSFPVFVSGIILSLYGFKFLKVVLIPLILLTFTFPIFPIHRITMPLQLLSSSLTSHLLNFLGINSFTEGSVINVENHRLAVVAGCSGLRSLSTLFFTSIIFTYFLQTRKIKKIFYVLFSIPLTITMNILRLTTVSFYSLYNGTDGLMKFHDDIGIVFSIISISILVLIAKYIDNDKQDQSEG